MPIHKPYRRITRTVEAGSARIGGEHPILVQSMCATRTQNISATLAQIQALAHAGAGLVRVAVDCRADVEALKEIRRFTAVPLVVDLQESYRLAEEVAPYVQKLRYNPGHLRHFEQSVAVKEKVVFLAEQAKRHGCAIRVGINFGSLGEPSALAQDHHRHALATACEHAAYFEDLNFHNYVVSLKSSDPNEVVDLNLLFAEKYPEVPLHLGVTEAGLLPWAETKTRAAFEELLSRGIGETIRVSLTLPADRKVEEVLIGKKIIEDLSCGRRQTSLPFNYSGLNLIACPSCARVENERFIELAEQVREVALFAAAYPITIAVMGCRVNGPGETDQADLGLWCAATHVNLKRAGRLVGQFSFEEVLDRVKLELQSLVAEKCAL